MTQANSYDEIRYPTEGYRQTFPDRLATAGVLMGMQPPPADRCRVLELGCGTGENLLSMALALPESEFVGLDFAASSIALARSAANTHGLRNVTFLQRDLLDSIADLGRFDYVVAHGVYSWTPAAVRDRVLAVCGECLTPQGIAFVSYTVYPGAYHRRMAREVLLYHAPNTLPERDRLDRARELLTFLAEAMPRPERYREIFRQENGLLERLGEGHYRHDNLDAFHESFYVHQFVEHAARHGLQYLSDSAMSRSMRGLYPPAVLDKLNQLAAPGGRLAREQYRDFLDGRLFRETLLCHQEVQLADEPQLEHVQELNVLSLVRPAQAQPGTSAAPSFQLPGGEMIRVEHPVVGAALTVLSEVAPGALAFRELLPRTQARLSGEVQARDLGDVLLIAEGAGLVELTVYRPRFTTTVSERPVASPLARWQISRGKPVVNLWLCAIKLDEPIMRHLCTLLDGSRDRATLADELAAYMQQQQLFPHRNDAAQTPIRDPETLRQLVLGNMGANLERFARLCLLVA